mgnify:CR=1 FL=1
MTVLDTDRWLAHGDVGALYLEPGTDAHLLGYRDLARAVQIGRAHV